MKAIIFLLVFNLNRRCFLEPNTTFTIVVFIDVCQLNIVKCEYFYCKSNIEFKCCARKKTLVKVILSAKMNSGLIVGSGFQ